MRKITALNDSWQYRTCREDSVPGPWQPAVLPHTNIELPFNCFDESDYQFVSEYRRDLQIPSELGEGLCFIDFEGVMASAEVFIDGKPAGSHKGGYTPFSVDITPLVSPGKTCELRVVTDSCENPDIPPFGKVIDYLTYGGIYREVQMRITAPFYIEDVFIRTSGIDKPLKHLDTEITLSNSGAAGGDEEFSLSARLFSHPEDTSPASEVIQKIKLPVGEKKITLSLKDLENIKLWDIDEPNLYYVEVALYNCGDEIDRVMTRTGFRSCRFTPRGFFLNGKRLKIRGLNRHQAFPYTGYAMPDRIQRRDADILKHELGLNLVRTSHYPQSRHFLDRCDEIGLLVFEEIPGWQHIGGAEWKKSAVQNVREMIMRDRNRPSVIIWGVRINESQDDHDFYTQTNLLARQLDDTRQTGGVRYIEKSELLEDVYTMNDFVHSGDEDKYRILRSPAKVTGRKAAGRVSVPYMVTEYNGHMYPTKRFDNEQRTREHALRHLRIIDRCGSDDSISGTIGWCAFDYNTHREFGSGDRICYHGVSDSFRLPKPAAAVYASQQNPEQKIVLEAASIFAKGERDAVRVLPIEVYTNCDYIKLFRNGNEVGDYHPAAQEYPGVPHPPVIIRDLVGKQLEGSGFSPKDQRILKEMISCAMLYGEEGLKPLQYLKLGLLMKRNRLKYPDMVDIFQRFNSGWGDSEDSFEIAGYYKGKEAVRRKYGSGSLYQLTIEADDYRLKARSETGCWDSTRIVFKLADQYGNIMPYTNEFISISLEGPAELIGPEKAAFTGGVFACWIKTTGSGGMVKVQAECSRLKSETINITVDE